MFDSIAKSFSSDDSPLEFIIIDLGPSRDEINKALVMSSDFILPPASADYFSCSSVRGLLYEALPSFWKWRKFHNQKIAMLDRSAREDLKGMGFYDFAPEEWPKVLPFLVGSYDLDGARKAGNIKRVSADFIHSIRI